MNALLFPVVKAAGLVFGILCSTDQALEEVRAQIVADGSAALNLVVVSNVLEVNLGYLDHLLL